MHTASKTVTEADAALQEIARRWIVHLESGRINEAELADLKAWLAADRAHRRAFEEVRAVWRGVGKLQHKYNHPYHPTASPVSASVEGALVRRRRIRTRFAIGGSLAAALACVLLSTGLLTRLQADHATAAGEIVAVTLPDGSTAELNTDSAIDVHYTDEERRIDLLRGEAWFKVASNAQRPFRVHAQQGVAEAVGTAFSVRDDIDRVTVSVTHGEVVVWSPAADHHRSAVHVPAGQEAIYLRAQPSGKPTPFDPDVGLSWRQRRLVIDELSLSKALAELDRYRPGRIVLLDNSRANIRVSGVFTLDEIDEGLEGFAAAQGLRVTYLSPYLAVLR